jgi:hypothetical protein
MNLQVICSGQKSSTINVEANTTILDIKKMIEAKENIPIDIPSQSSSCSRSSHCE